MPRRKNKSRKSQTRKRERKKILQTRREENARLIAYFSGLVVKSLFLQGGHGGAALSSASLPLKHACLYYNKPYLQVGLKSLEESPRGFFEDPSFTFDTHVHPKTGKLMDFDFYRAVIRPELTPYEHIVLAYFALIMIFVVRHVLPKGKGGIPSGAQLKHLQRIEGASSLHEMIEARRALFQEITPYCRPRKGHKKDRARDPHQVVKEDLLSLYEDLSRDLALLNASLST